MKTALTLIMLVLMAGTVLAHIDPTPDAIGIYFDLDATSSCTTTAAPFSPVTAYLLITNISTTQTVTGWEAQAWTEGSVPVAPGWSLADGSDADPSPIIFRVGINPLSPVVPPSNGFLLATWTGFVMQPLDIISFHVSGVPGSEYFPDSPGYTTEGIVVPELHPLHVSSYGFDDSVAFINWCPVANETNTFTELKTLFR